MPAVDVVIPTFNCAASLERCLGTLRAQRYAGQFVIWIVDGGSTDRTLEVARAYNARTFVNSGQYSAGLTGARHYGETLGCAPYVWCLDSDNFVVESTVLLDLVASLESDTTIQLAIPITAVDPAGSSFSNFLALDEIHNIHRVMARGRRNGAVVVVDEMDYGLTNATMIRRSALERVGGYDSDVRVLWRLRRNGLARTAIVETAHFQHDQASSWWDYRQKWCRRVVRYGWMTREDIRCYFVEPVQPAAESDRMISAGVDRAAFLPLRAIRSFLNDRNPTWLWGLTYPAIPLSILLQHPFLARRAWRNFSTLT